MDKHTWIQTRDGSPTLWSNELSESFRSLKGAFTESFKVFIEPALADLKKSPREAAVIGEFGLGPGTNWLMAQLFLAPQFKKLSYFAIERDPSIFKQGLEKWKLNAEFLADFTKAQGAELSVEQVTTILDQAMAPLTMPSIELAFPSGLRCDFWFHDPFGYDVNPEGYSVETLKMTHVFFKQQALGMSYACNKHFQNALLDANFKFEVLPTGEINLKRDRIVFKIA